MRGSLQTDYSRVLEKFTVLSRSPRIFCWLPSTKYESTKWNPSPEIPCMFLFLCIILDISHFSICFMPVHLSNKEKMGQKTSINELLSPRGTYTYNYHYCNHPVSIKRLTHVYIFFRFLGWILWKIGIVVPPHSAYFQLSHKWMK